MALPALAGISAGYNALFSTGTSIGTIDIPISVEERYESAIQTTQHPIEAGADITDHAYVLPNRVTLKCVFGNSGIAALISAAQNLLSSGSIATAGDNATNVYMSLIALMESRTPVTVTTIKRQFPSMLVRSVMVDVDKDTSSSVYATIELIEIFQVSTASTSYPNSNAPTATGAVQNTGTKQATVQ